MDRTTQKRLNDINHVFYRASADAFSQTRNHAWPGWHRIIALLQTSRGEDAQTGGNDEGARQSAESAEVGSSLRVLDVGCGNARFAHFLTNQTLARIRYLGVDISPRLLEIATPGPTSIAPDDYRLCELDLLEPIMQGKDEKVGSTLSPGPFDLIVAFGLLHHVPGRQNRIDLCRELHSRLAPGGLLVLTAWQFGDSPRYAERMLSWSEYNRDQADPVDLGQLEPGDHLLGFGSCEGPPRYCHHLAPAEFETLVRALPGRLLAEYRADGKSGDLNLYVVVQNTRVSESASAT